MHNKFGFVYIWRDKKNNRYYIGSHWGTEDDGYICSSNWMRDAYKRRPLDFKRRILSRVYTNRIDTFLEEERFLKMIKSEELRKRYYNISNSVKDHWIQYEGKALSIKDKISQSLKGRLSPNKGKTFSEEWKHNLSKSHIGNPGHWTGKQRDENTKKKNQSN